MEGRDEIFKLRFGDLRFVRKGLTFVKSESVNWND